MALGSNVNPSNYQEIGRNRLPKFDANQPIERESDRIVGGTGVVIFQGITIRPNVNGKTGEHFSKKALVYAVLQDDSRFKNFGIYINEEVLNITLPKMGLEVPIIEKPNPLGVIPGLEGFSGTFDIDVDKLDDVVYPVRGKIFTARMKRTQSDQGKFYFELNFESLTPVMVNGEHKALQKPEETKPEIVDDFDWDE